MVVRRDECMAVGCT